MGDESYSVEAEWPTAGFGKVSGRSSFQGGKEIYFLWDTKVHFCSIHDATHVPFSGPEQQATMSM